MQKQTIFYSWQSDLPNNTNRGFIQEQLELAVEELKKNEQLTVDPVVDRDTAGVAGSPDIGLTIFTKISKAAVFVCDVSIIQNPAGGRATPNPNVLIELGYALKTMGASRIIMVMNTAHGGPELLPFDLKQKRVLTYNLPSGSEKKEAKKTLKGSFVEAVKAVLGEIEESEEEVEPADPALTVIEALKNKEPDIMRKVRSYFIWTVNELDHFDEETFEGEEDEKLFQAIQKTIPLVKGFDSIANATSAYGVNDVAIRLFKAMEPLVSRFRTPPGFSGTYRTSDFDLYKFVGHEMLVILIAYLMKDERWELINEILQTRIHMENHPSGRPDTVGFDMMSQHLPLLDEVRTRRLVVNNQRRVSIHADILKDRHEKLPLAENLTWQEFKDADHFLCLYSIIHDRGEFGSWWPRTLVYFGDRIPRFMIDGYSKNGAANLAKALGIKNEELRDKLQEAIEKYRTVISRSSHGFTSDPYWGFDVQKIGAT